MPPHPDLTLDQGVAASFMFSPEQGGDTGRAAQENSTYHRSNFSYHRTCPGLRADRLPGKRQNPARHSGQQI